MTSGHDLHETTPASGLSSAQIRTLRAVIDCIHPHDDLGPSGTDLGIDEYILRALAGQLVRYQAHYRAFLDHVEAAARSRHVRDFANLQTDAKVALLKALTGGDGEEVETPAGLTDGMTLVVEHTYEGLFGDPAYGGNRGGAGWALVGYPGPRTAVPVGHQLLDVVVPTSSASIYENPNFVLEHAHG